MSGDRAETEEEVEAEIGKQVLKTQSGFMYGCLIEMTTRNPQLRRTVARTKVTLLLGN